MPHRWIPPRRIRLDSPKSRLIRWICFVCLGIGLPPALASAQPESFAKEDAPGWLRALVAEGDAVELRRESMALRLERRDLEPEQGLDSAWRSRALSPAEPALAIASWSTWPGAADWEEWRALGIRYLEYLGNRHWLVELTADAEEVFSRSQATTLVEFLPSDKISIELDRYELHPEFFDPDRGLVVVDVTVRRGTDPEALRELERRFHVPGPEYRDRSTARTVTLVMDPGAMADLAERHRVLAVEPGAWQREVLMDGVRAAVNGDVVTGPGGTQLTGARIRAATNERLYTGSVHEAFWHHDSTGNPTVPRWSQMAAESCIEPFSSTAWHGLASAGILLGNGWFSDRYTDGPETFRGLAPEAILECYDQPGATTSRVLERR